MELIIFIGVVLIGTVLGMVAVLMPDVEITREFKSGEYKFDD